MYLLVEVLQQLPTGCGYGLVNFQTEIHLQLVERGDDLCWLTAPLVYVSNALFEVNAGLNGTEYFVTGPEHSLEQLELVREKLKDPLVGCIVAIEKVHHDHVMLLAVPMAAADALFNALRVPR